MKNKKAADEFETAFWKGKKFLVISPHPDDEVFGCAGTMAKAKALGAEVYALFFTVDDLRFFEKRGWVTGRERLNEIKKVSRLLGWDGYDIVYANQDKHLKLDAVPQADLITRVERTGPMSLQNLKPDIVAIPAPSYNQDHVAVYDACFTALRIHAGGNKHTPDFVLVYDSPTLYWNHPGKEFHPNFYVDITPYLELKLKSIRIYASQRRDPKDPCSIENIQEMAHVRGREAGRNACEAYTAYRVVL